MSGLLSLIFISVFFVVTFSFAFHYWQESNYKIAVRWTLGACICVIAGVFFSVRHYPSTVVRKVTQRGRPYVVVRDSTLDPLTVGKSPVLIFSVTNTGTVETEGYFRDMTCRLIDWGTPRFLRYIHNDTVIKFSLAPGQNMIMRCPFNAPVLDDYLIKMLNDDKVGLYMFARGQYSDEMGRSYQITFCQQHAPVMPGHLANCDDSISFKEPEEGDQ